MMLDNPERIRAMLNLLIDLRDQKAKLEKPQSRGCFITLTHPRDSGFGESGCSMTHEDALLVYEVIDKSLAGSIAQVEEKINSWISEEYNKNISGSKDNNGEEL